jgi:ABC-2 type transport system permease protein
MTTLTYPPAARQEIPFGNLFRAELAKITSIRAARLLLAATALLAVAAEAVPVIFTHDVTQNRASYLTWSALGLTRLLPIVLIMAMTAEYSQRTALTTFTVEPRRALVLTAKVASGLTLSAVAGLFALVVTSVTVAVVGASGHHHIATSWDWAELAGFVLFVMATSAIGIALGAAVHNTAAAIVTFFALAAAFNLLMIPALAKAGAWVNTTQTFGWMVAGQWSGHIPQIVVSAALWILLPLAIGTARTVRRDIS